MCQELIRIPSVNLGEGDGDERAAAEYVAERLAEVGLEPTILQSAPRADERRRPVRGRRLRPEGRCSCTAISTSSPPSPTTGRSTRSRGEIRDGCVWGRGAVDMKDSNAMSLAVVRALARSGRKPPRDLVLAFVADEEAGGVLGARWLVDNRPDLFEGCTEAISEVGGFSYTLRDDLRLYLIETAQKGMAWMRLTATGRAGHGSFVPEDNAVTRLCQAVARLGTHRFPIQLTPTVRTFLDAVSESTGVAFDPADPERRSSRGWGRWPG